MPRAPAGDRQVLTHRRRGEPSSRPTTKLLPGRVKGAELIQRMDCSTTAHDAFWLSLHSLPLTVARALRTEAGVDHVRLLTTASARGLQTFNRSNSPATAFNHAHVSLSPPQSKHSQCYSYPGHLTVDKGQ